MFSEKRERKKLVEPGSAQNRINEGTRLVGDVSSTGFFRIDGCVEGNVKTPSKVVLGKLGMITGTLVCESADIEGRFEGNLQVFGTLTLRATAVVDGDVIVGKLAVEPGAVMNASCTMQNEDPKVSRTNLASVMPSDTNNNPERLSTKKRNGELELTDR